MPDAAYDRFITSPEWQVIRANAVRRAGKICQACASPFRLQVHHITYKRFGGDELPEDLMVLCEPCHMAHHGIRKSGVKRRGKAVLARIEEQSKLQRRAARAKMPDTPKEWKPKRKVYGPKKWYLNRVEPWKQDPTTKRRPSSNVNRNVISAPLCAPARGRIVGTR